MKKQRVIIHNDADRMRFIERLKSATLDKPIEIEYGFYRKNRSNAQNKLMWLWNSVIREWAWNAGIGYVSSGTEPERPFTAEEIHAWNKAAFLKPITIQMGGFIVSSYETHSLNTRDFTEYLNTIEMHWASQGCMLPHPDDLYYEAMNEENFKRG